MDISLLIEELAQNSIKLFMTITGGGTGVIPALLENGGASSVFIGAEVPYSYEIAPHPFGYVHQDYASKLAEYGLQKIKSTDKENLFNKLSIGVTASLYKKDQRAERINQVFITSLLRIAPRFASFRKNQTFLRHERFLIEDRLQQEDLVTQFILEEIKEIMELG